MQQTGEEEEDEEAGDEEEKEQAALFKTRTQTPLVGWEKGDCRGARSPKGYAEGD